MKQLESKMQIGCVTWFRTCHPRYARLLFSVPNGGMRNAGTARRLKAEGVVSGVSDLILLMPNSEYHGLCIELKTNKGRQTANQKSWEQDVQKQGYQYIVVRSFDEFVSAITQYLRT